MAVKIAYFTTEYLNVVSGNGVLARVQVRCLANEGFQACIHDVMLSFDWLPGGRVHA